MRNMSAKNAAALQARRLVARDFLWITAKNLTTGAAFEYGFWSDVGNVTAQILNPNTGLPESRNFEGSGTLIQVGEIALVANMSVQNVDITLSEIDDAVVNLVRGYDLKQAGVEIYRGMFDPVTRAMVDPAFCRFFGFVDEVEITKPSEGEEGAIKLVCASSAQELSRSNTDTRSHDSQVLRNRFDEFFRDATTVGDWEFFWGKNAGKIISAGAQRIGTNIKAANR